MWIYPRASPKFWQLSRHECGRPRRKSAVGRRQRWRAVGREVMVSPDSVRYYIRDIDAANELADYNSDVKMTRPNLLAYLDANGHSTATKRAPQHIKQWQLHSAGPRDGGET